MDRSAQVEIEVHEESGEQAIPTASISHITENRESLSENFEMAIEAWARQALAANGFGDYQA